MAVTTICMWGFGANWAWNPCFFFQNNLNGADWSRHIFVRSVTAMALNKNPAMSSSLSVHCGQYETTCVTLGCILRKGFADDTILGDERKPSRTYLKNRSDFERAATDNVGFHTVQTTTPSRGRCFQGLTADTPVSSIVPFRYRELELLSPWLCGSRLNCRCRDDEPSKCCYRQSR